MEGRVEYPGITTIGIAAIAALAGLAIGLITLKDLLPIIWLALLEAGIILSIVILIFYIFLGRRIRLWRSGVAYRKKLNEIAHDFYPELKILINDFAKFVGGTGYTDYALSRIYDDLRQRRNFVALQELPNENVLSGLYRNLRNDMHRLGENAEHFSMLSHNLYELINLLAYLTRSFTSILSWLGPTYRDYIKTELKDRKITTTSEFDAWIHEQYAIDEKTKNNYLQFREKFNDFRKDYNKFAKQVNERAGSDIIPASTHSIRDRID